VDLPLVVYVTNSTTMTEDSAAFALPQSNTVTPPQQRRSQPSQGSQSASAADAYCGGDIQYEGRLVGLFGVKPLAQKRSAEDAKRLVITCSKHERAQLKIDNRRAYDALIERAKAPLKNDLRFSIMVPKQGSEELKTLYDVSYYIEVLRQECEEVDIADAFMIARPLKLVDGEVAVASSKSEKLDLLTNFNDLSFEEVSLHCQLVQERLPDPYAEDLRLTLKKVLNSCDTDLAKKIQERFPHLEEHQKVGPCVFKIMMDLVMASNQEGIHAILTFVRTHKLSDVPGENVLELSSMFRGAITYLKCNKALPPDIMQVIYNALRACSTPAFVSKVDNMYNNPVTGVKHLTLDEYLASAEATYRTMSTKKPDGSVEWAGGAPSKESGFYFNGKCHICGEFGHKASDCSKRNHSNHRSSRSNGRRQGPRGSNGGGTPSGGRSPTSNDQQEQRPRSQNPKYIPPPDGKPQSRKRDGIDENYCTKCKRWVTTHTDATHTPRGGKKDDDKTNSNSTNQSNKQQAHVAYTGI